MFRYDISKNELIEVDETSFSAKSIKERQHIEEWIRKNPLILGEELLIIAHEYDRFEINERLDLLAIDKYGKLVIIELKQDTSGATVEFQALKYCSYCSTFTPEEIIDIFKDYANKHSLKVDPAETLLQFLDLESAEDLNNTLNNAQRIIIVGNEIDKRILSVSAWLANNNIDVKCIRITPYEDSNKDVVYVDVEQVIPPQKIEDYFIKKKVEAKSLGKLSQPADVQSFFATVVAYANSKGNHAYYYERKSYCSIRSGLSSNLVFALAIKKRTSQFAIEVYCTESRTKKILLDTYHDMKQQIESETGLKFEEFAEGQYNAEWGRIVAYIPLDNKIPLESYASEIGPKFVGVADIVRKYLKDKF